MSPLTMFECPGVLYHGTTEVKYEQRPAQYGPGWQEARQMLESLASRLGIQHWDDVASILERWSNQGLLDQFGVDASTPALARKARDLATPQVFKPVAKIGFDRFNLPFGTNELGVHFGTYDQALHRGHPFAFMLKMSRVIRMPDLGTWHYQSVLRELKSLGIHITDDQYEAVFQAHDNNQALRSLMRSHGIDGVVYANEAEGRGDSWIALDQDQIVFVEEPADGCDLQETRAPEQRPSW